MDEEACVKEECEDSRDGCGVSEAAKLAGLYDEHEVKDKLVLGPERPHRPIVGLLVKGWAVAAAGARRAQLAKDSSVRLERLHTHGQHHTTTAHTVTESEYSNYVVLF
ncbi:uncharacterized protein LOC134753201 [Cydia strobilella]|uniref:uncharacterized protein LOC134753201 n=1 Tax=Cydia strobilella TaxID=1100964 RepID=UPI0030061E4D